jgi:catechol 2,3-dioxygenase-like lactoylglutathione lyase family enzyme
MRVHHLAFRTDDLARLERFYVDAIGLAVVRRQDNGSVWLDAGGTIVMLERREEGEAAVPPGSRELVAFTIEPEARALAAARLERAGVAIEAATDFTMYARDPDGRRVALSSYPAKLEPKARIT